MPQSTPACFSLRFNAEKILDHGEDADPLVIRRPEYGVLLGVFDGMGGSGAQTYRTESGDHSGAYLASRHAQASSGKWFETVALPPTTDAELAVSLGDALATAMRAYLATLGAKPSRIASRMIRQLPTTAALLVVNTVGPTSAEATVRCHALWAGDSRAFVLTGQEGLAQLTTDHLRSEGDAQENLLSDSPMSNFVSASQPFEIDHRNVQVDLPAILCTATDGCFGYVPSPASFELLMLTTLSAAHDMDDWAHRLRAEIATIAADDASMALLAVGWDTFEELRAGFARRCREVSELLGPVEEAKAAFVESRTSLEIARLDADWDRSRAAAAAADAALAASPDDRAAKLATRVAELAMRVEDLRYTEYQLVGFVGRQPDDACGNTDFGEYGRRLFRVQEALAAAREELARMRHEHEEVHGPVPLPEIDDRLRVKARDDMDRASAAVQAAATVVWGRYRIAYERYLREPGVPPVVAEIGQQPDHDQPDTAALR